MFTTFVTITVIVVTTVFSPSIPSLTSGLITAVRVANYFAYFVNFIEDFIKNAIIKVPSRVTIGVWFVTAGKVVDAYREASSINPPSIKANHPFIMA